MPKLHRFSILSIVLSVFAIPALAAEWPGLALYQKNGAAAIDKLGYSVASAGDVNGDGFSDFIIGANAADPGGFFGAGSAYVYSGATGGLLYQKDGAAAGDELGISVAGAGDANGDGRADFIIGAWQADPGGLSGAGSAYVYSGADGSLLYQKNGAEASDFLGRSVAGVGDVNGDGRADFIVGAYLADPGGLSGAGSAYVYSGADGSLLYQKNGAEASDFLGSSVASAGDVNGDGRADFIVSAILADGPGVLFDVGSVYVYSGTDGSLLLQKDGAVVSERLGTSVAGAGDVDGDGRADFIAGAYFASPGGLTDAGSAYVYSGANGSLLFQKNGAVAGDQLGFSVSGLEDLNGDGKADFIIGAPGADPGGLGDAGSAFVLAAHLVNISRISDFPNDQGKQVRMGWKWFPISDPELDLFIIYRRIDGASLSSTGGHPPMGAEALALPPGNWEIVGSVPASGDTVYATVVPTVVDSTPVGGLQYSVFFIRGRATQPNLFIDSPIDSGYSVDNLVPAAPGALAALGTCQGNELSCSAPVDEDFQYFKFYRDVSSDFASPVVVGNTTDSFFVDAAPTGQTFYYRVRVVDFSGNEGNFSPLANALAGLKGDLNNSGSYSGADIVTLIAAVFNSAPFPAPFCAADLNCSRNLSGADIVTLINVVFNEASVTCTP